MESAETVQRLRPAGMQSQPVLIDEIFDDVDLVLSLIRERGPYRTMAAYHNMEHRIGGARTQPFFRGLFEDDLFLQNPRWIKAARQAFSARIVRPFKCIVNLNGPMSGTGVHVDLPLFRGLVDLNLPVWLLMNMTYSNLFQDWMVPIASGLAWFYRGTGGAFAYWPQGAQGPAQLVRAPFRNNGVMSDNEAMFHGVSPTGSPVERARLQGELRASDCLHAGANNSWEIRDGDRVAHRLSAEQIRISLLWKGYVFHDEAHLASFENRAMELTIDQVVDIYLDDIARRGIAASRPLDPLGDGDWQRLIEATYVQQLSPLAAETLN